MGFRVVEHTADVAVELWAPDEAALLVEGLRAIVSLMTEGAALAPDASRQVSIDALDPEDRLVQWLNEIIYLALVEGFLASDAVVGLREGGLDATLAGVQDAAHLIRGELKSVTYHELELRRFPDRVETTIVIDV